MNVWDGIGTVIKVFLTETKPPKEKRLIVIGESFDKLLLATVFDGTVWIVSESVSVHLFVRNELSWII
jgi:hypothetical protein